MRKEKSCLVMKVIYYTTPAVQGILKWCFISRKDHVIIGSYENKKFSHAKKERRL